MFSRSSRSAMQNDLVFGVAPDPVRCGLGLEIGAGKVYPEVNFTLPTMESDRRPPGRRSAPTTRKSAGKSWRDARLKAPGLVLEFEHLPPMTERPEVGRRTDADSQARASRKRRKKRPALRARVTPTDIREKMKPPLMRQGEPCEQLCARLN